MTPHLPDHLTHEELCDILLARSPHPLSSDFGALQQHLANCSACTTELANLRTSLSVFRQASTSYAQQQLIQFHVAGTPTPSKTILQPIYWAAAAALCIAAVFPFTLSHRQTPTEPISSASTIQPATTSQSDEALLEEVNQEISAPIPSPMQPLADPTASPAVTPSISSQRN
ncbi:MAG TPA: hypothetical protein VNY78_04510 [Edaphobacter sp.]|nr:hypothetical protein [Edaphobacter sp.]